MTLFVLRFCFFWSFGLLFFRLTFSLNQRINLILYNFYCTRLITFLRSSFAVTDVPPFSQPAEIIFLSLFLFFFSHHTQCNLFLFSGGFFSLLAFFLPFAFSFSRFCFWLIRLVLHYLCSNFYTFCAALICSISVSVSVMFLFLSAV